MDDSNPRKQISVQQSGSKVLLQMREEQSRIKYCSQKEWFSSSGNANNYTKAKI